MKLQTLSAGTFKLDGGAMFGVVPKTIWSKQIPADDLNLCTWDMRCLLYESGNRLVLIDTGMGEKQSDKWRGFYYPTGDGLEAAIQRKGYEAKEVTDVILSHLHFDHCGGAVKWNKQRTGYETTFQNARYWTHSSHWAWGQNANPREKATFMSENLQPMQQAGQLYFIDQTSLEIPEINCLTADGHTEKMLMPLIAFQDKKILFVADTIPSTAHVHVPYVMSYDVRPLQTMLEKEALLERAVAEKLILVFDHDPHFEAALIGKNDRGYFCEAKGLLSDFL